MATADTQSAKMEDIKRSVQPQLENLREHMPNRSQVVGVLSWLAVGLVAVTVGGVTFTAGAVFLAIATPIFLFFSPILVPVGSFLFIGTAGALLVVGIALAALSAAIWMFRYLKGEEPVYYDRVDAARDRIAGTALEVKEWARDHVPHAHAAPSA